MNACVYVVCVCVCVCLCVYVVCVSVCVCVCVCVCVSSARAETLPPAVNGNAFARDEQRLVANKEGNEVCHFLRLANLK